MLEQKELAVAISHEIGHIKQGPWKISLLKILSSFALFPNYYLTLCIDWAKKEIDADRFAVMATQDPQSLKQALVKMSVAQIEHTTRQYGHDNMSAKLLKTFKNELRSIMISIKFFFGDSLFGYAHPFLSERLQEIDNI
ncbi:MAG: M48 family metalloprotease [Anaerohalosphaera sp.]|nr:M48 family metalloprotease [Anaerohalosphaera sp.]